MIKHGTPGYRIVYLIHDLLPFSLLFRIHGIVGLPAARTYSEDWLPVHLLGRYPFLFVRLSELEKNDGLRKVCAKIFRAEHGD